MTEDELYIENHRYLADAFFVLPLPSGKLAILTPRRDLFRVVESWEEARRVGPEAGREKPPGKLFMPQIKLKDFRL
jgi:hypothetical protein